MSGGYTNGGRVLDFRGPTHRARGVARSMAVHPSARPLPDDVATKAALMSLTADEREDVLWHLARAHPGIVDAAIRRVVLAREDGA